MSEKYLKRISKNVAFLAWLHIIGLVLVGSYVIINL